ncbi:MAG TPA: glutamine synthetase family protein [Nocardioidaceae bacterium]|nr:glutamine synthetase family protein [Nocardioidaceae bacterium]
MARASSPLSLDALRKAVDSDEIDSVVVAFTDMQGRLQGKIIHARFFLDEVLPHGTEGCNYLLAVDVEMNTVPGYAISSWERGYGDMEFVLDMDTLRRIPWQPSTAMVQCDLGWLDDDRSPVDESPRTILKAQAARAADMGFTALAGTELEFLVFDDTYENAWNSDYRGLTPGNQYNVDYSLLGTARLEPLLRDIRNGMYRAGLTVESVKGECNLGQHEIAFRYDDVVRTADQHAVYKNGAKEIAAQHGKALTFMAKFNEREGNSCHMHMSLRGTDGSIVFDEGDGPTTVFESFVAGVQATLEEFTLLYAPNVNSYKRFQPGSFAPTAVAWGRDNRTCALRVVGHGAGLRVENRVPGGDMNPYLGLAGMLAGGLYGIENKLELEPPLEGNAYTSDKPHVPRTLRDARDAFAGSAVARASLGDAVVDHYVNAADVELLAFNAAVTDWERIRGFERL